MILPLTFCNLLSVQSSGAGEEAGIMQQAFGPRLRFFSGLAASLTAAELATAYPATFWNPAH